MLLTILLLKIVFQALIQILLRKVGPRIGEN